MTKKYTISFRQNAVELLHDISLDSCFTRENIQIKNVRQLCEFLGISSNTLYRWQKEFSPLKSEKKDVSDEITFDNSGEKIENGERINGENIPKRIECYAENWCKAYQSEIDEVNPNCNMLGVCTGFKPLVDVADVLIFKDKMRDAYKNGGDIHESESELTKLYLGESEVSGVSEVASDGFHYERDPLDANKITKIAPKARNLMNLEPKISTFCSPVIALKKSKSTGEFNPSIELNLIKALYANRFGTTTNKLKSHMIGKIVNAWRVK